MKAVTVAIIIIFSICFSQNVTPDSLKTHHKTIGYDKIQHVAFSCLWTLSSQYILENKSDFGQDNALSYSIGSAISLGMAKELNDSHTRKKRFDWGDMLANGVGIAIAVLIVTH